MRYIWVTGENGHIGSYLINELKKVKGYTILDPIDIVKRESHDGKVVTFESKNYSFIDGVRVKQPEFDFTNKNNLFVLFDYLKTLDDLTDLLIVHSGACVGTDKCESDDFEAVRVNTLGTQFICAYLRESWIPYSMFYISTTAINDPESYENNYPFDENAIINPKTIYGLTKYCGELAVESLDNYTIIKPVFIYGDAPIDNSSILRKICEVTYRKYVLGQDVKNLDVLLDPNIDKNYCRIELFIDMLKQFFMKKEFIKNRFFYHKEHFVLTAEQPNSVIHSYPFSFYLETIKKVTGYQNLPITLYPEKDYSKNHIATSAKFYRTFPEYYPDKELFDTKKGIEKTWKSISFLEGK